MPIPLLAMALGGAVIGALANPDDRKKGALAGLGVGLLGPAAAGAMGAGAAAGAAGATTAAGAAGAGAAALGASAGFGAAGAGAGFGESSPQWVKTRGRSKKRRFIPRAMPDFPLPRTPVFGNHAASVPPVR